MPLWQNKRGTRQHACQGWGPLKLVAHFLPSWIGKKLYKICCIFIHSTKTRNAKMLWLYFVLSWSMLDPIWINDWLICIDYHVLSRLSASWPKICGCNSNSSTVQTTCWGGQWHCHCQRYVQTAVEAALYIESSPLACSCYFGTVAQHASNKSNNGWWWQWSIMTMINNDDDQWWWHLSMRTINDEIDHRWQSTMVTINDDDQFIGESSWLSTIPGPLSFCMVLLLAALPPHSWEEQLLEQLTQWQHAANRMVMR